MLILSNINNLNSIKKHVLRINNILKQNTPHNKKNHQCEK